MTDIKFLSQNRDQLQTLIDRYGFQRTTLPAGNFRRQVQAVPTIGYHTILATSARLPDDLAYRIVKTVVEERESLIQSHRGGSTSHFPAAAQVESLGAPLHPGADRYYREVGLLR